MTAWEARLDMAGAAPALRIDADLCVAHNGCRECVNVCGPHALDIVGGLARLTDPDACDLNGACFEACPVGAIVLPVRTPYPGLSP